jgi:hypothetical protein
MITFIHNDPIWEYFSSTQKDLIQEGNYLMNITEDHGYRFKDYSFLVFPYAKAYEGYLKQLFLDLNFISHLDYISDHFRIGKYLSPHLTMRLGDRSIYTQIIKNSNEDLAARIWDIWKKGRNEVFHYYPHNIKKLTFTDAQNLNEEILSTMLDSYEKLKVNGNIKEFARE